MTNVTNPLMENFTYNLTKIFSPEIIQDPPYWLANFNQELGGLAIFTILIVFGVVLFFASRSRPETSDSEAALLAGSISTIVGVLLFIVDIVALPQTKLLTWIQLVPFIVFTAVFAFVNHMNKNY